MFNYTNSFKQTEKLIAETFLETIMMGNNVLILL